MATFLQDAVTGARQLQALKADKMALEKAQKQQAGIDEASGLLKQYYDSQKAGKPNQELLISATLKSPQLAGQMLDVMGLTDKQEQQRVAGDVSQLYMASQDPQTFFAQASKLRNQYMQEGRDVEDIDEIAIAYKERGPEAALQMMKVLAAPLEAKGYKTGVFAEQAEAMTPYQQASTDLRRQELEMRKQEKMFETQMKVLEARARKETDEIKKQELELRTQELQQKIDDAKRARETASNEKVADLEQAFFGIDNMLNTVQRIKQSPKLDSVVGTVQGRMDAYLDDEAAATIRLIENLGSQAFMAMIPGLKGMGALSNAEGDKLAASLQNLSRVTGEKQFRDTLAEVERLMNKSRGIIAKRYNKPESKPDVPAAQPAEPALDDLLKQYGGGQ